MASSTEPTHLAKAPIREAVFDIRVQVPGKTTAQHLESLHKMVAADYPTKQTKRWIKGELQLQPTGPAITTGHGVLGYLFTSADATRVVQFRLDGFSFSRLAPYETWDDFMAEAKRLWTVYKEHVQPDAITKVAVRYINELAIPEGQLGWREYLRTPPRFLPEGIGHPVSQFLTRYSATDVDNNVTWQVTFALTPEDGPSKRMLLDIDTFKLDNFEDDAHIWETALLLRQAKNSVFFGTLSEHALELCR